MQRHCTAFAVFVTILAAGVTAEALGSVGVKAGIVQRRANWFWPDSLRTGFGFEAHADVDLHPLFKLGPYYLHSSVGGRPEPLFGVGDGEARLDGVTFNGVGLRTRFLLPIPGRFKPYALAGLGYTWATHEYSGALGDQSGAFFETPIGIGIAYELNQLVSFSLDASYRHAFWHHGNGYDGDGTYGSTGTSFLVGVALGI